MTAEEVRSLPLTDLQRAYLMGGGAAAAVGERATHAYMELVCSECNPKTAIEALKRELSDNDTFSLVVTWEDERPRQKFVDAPAPQVDCEDMRTASPEERETRMREKRRAMFNEQFDPERLPRYHVAATLVADDRVVLHMACDGMLLDGGSLLELQRRLDARICEAQAARAGKPQPPLPPRFSDYVLQTTQREASVADGAEGSGFDFAPTEDDEAYWIETLRGFDEEVEFQNPADVKDPSPDPEDCIVNDETGCQFSRDISPAAWSAFEKAAKAVGLTPFSLCLAFYGHAVSRYSGASNFCINIPGRPLSTALFGGVLGHLSSFLLAGYSESSAPSTETMVDRARRLATQLWMAKDHDSLSGPSLLGALSRARGHLVQAPIVLTSMLEAAPDTTHVEIGCMMITTSQTQLELAFHRAERQTVRMVASANPARIEPFMARGIVEMVAAGIEAFAAGSSSDATQLPLCARDRALLKNVSHSAKAACRSAPLSRLLFDNLASLGEKPAIIDESGVVSYCDLANACRAVVKHLEALVDADARRTLPGSFDSARTRAEASRNHSTIGLLLRKGRNQAIAEAACIVGSHAFMPLNAELPPNMLAACLLNAGVRVLVCDDDTEGLANRVCTAEAQAEGVTIVSLTDLLQPQAERADWSRAVVSRLDEYMPHALCINTSGTTGKPKTVSINDWALGSCLAASRELYGLADPIRTIALTNFGHDMALFDIIGPLAYGGTVVVPSEKTAKEPRAWLELICTHAVNTWSSVPAFAQMFLQLETEELSAANSLGTFIFGGDFLAPGVCRRLKETYPSARIFNCGGPSETTLWNIAHEVVDADIRSGSIPYGTPFPGTRYTLLDACGRICPVGVPGNMHVTGTSVSNGYLRDNVLVDAGFSTVEGERAYPTGDWGVVGLDGELHILGRRDSQVKINGKRIELAGIENALSGCKNITSAVVVAAGSPAKLRAFAIAHGEVDPADLRAELAGLLPAYMIPGQIALVPTFPQTANAKIDRKALADADPAQMPASRVIDLMTAGEDSAFDTARRLMDTHYAAVADKVLAIASEVLESPVALADNFYSLGGDSLRAMQVSARAERLLGIDLKVYDLLARAMLSSWVDLALEALEKQERSNQNDAAELEQAVCNAAKRYLELDDIGETVHGDFLALEGDEEIAHAIARELSDAANVKLDAYDLMFTPRMEDWPQLIMRLKQTVQPK